MKILMHNSYLLAVIMFPALVLGCAQTSGLSREPVSREKVVENLNPIVNMETRGTKLTMALQQLPLIAKLTPEDARQLKEYYDVYYVYHNAAATSLAEGNIQAYQDHVKVASKELDSLEAKLKEVVKKSSRQGPYEP